MAKKKSTKKKTRNVLTAMDADEVEELMSTLFEEWDQAQKNNKKIESISGGEAVDRRAIFSLKEAIRFLSQFNNGTRKTLRELRQND